jgi:hypothetical protein
MPEVKRLVANIDVGNGVMEQNSAQALQRRVQLLEDTDIAREKRYLQCLTC